MVEELFKEKKPGISSHGENPKEVHGTFLLV